MAKRGLVPGLENKGNRRKRYSSTKGAHSVVLHSLSVVRHRKVNL